jgi:hypothetical protein
MLLACIMGSDMSDQSITTIPARAQTLTVLRYMSPREPILMLPGEEDGYGTRWDAEWSAGPTCHRAVPHGRGLIAETGRTELGARKLTLTTAGLRVREDGIHWWSGLSLSEKLRVIIFG